MKIAARYVFLLMLVAQPTWAAEVFLHVFFEEAPLQNVNVSIDGDSVGSTDNRGALATELDAGSFTMELSFQGNEIAEVDFTITDAASEEVEIEVSYGRNLDEPDVNVMTFAVGDSGGQTGILSGTVRDTDGNPVAGATLRSNGYSTTTSADGTFGLELPRGEQDVSVSASGFAAANLPNVRIFANVGVAAEVELTTQRQVDLGVAPPQLEEVFVLGTFNPTDTAQGTERYATTITDALDLEQISRFGDSDVAAALVRIVGVSVAEDKYATVRGLDGRYISATLNGLLMPSTDPLRRDVQLDLFPSNILGGLEIQKTFAPEQLATTTGGSVKITTLGLPDERIHKIGLSTAYNFDYTGDDIVSYRSSETDKYGWDNDLRELPSGVLQATNGARQLTVCPPEVDPSCTSELDAARLAVRFQDDYNVEQRQAKPDFGASWAFGDRYALGEGDFGFYAAANYSSETKDRGTADLNDALDIVGQYNRSTESTASSAYLVAGYEFREADQILSKTIYLHNSDDTTRFETGFDTAEDNNEQRVILEWVERDFFSQQFSGLHDIYLFDETHTLDWNIGYSRTERDEPDRRQYRYINDQLALSAFERRWSNLEEESYDAVVNYTLPLNWSNNVYTEFKVGGLYSDKEREVELYRFGIRAGSRSDLLDFSVNANLEETLSYNNAAIDGWRLGTNTTTTDSYNADEKYTAGYVAANTDIGEAWTLSIGARYEDFEQELEYPNDPEAGNLLEEDDIYPSASLTYRLGEDWQFRLGYSETVSYPGLIERAESLVFDPNTDDPIFGNPDLVVSKIENYDLRIEYYFSTDESISLAYFQKDIEDPIERTVPDASGSAANNGITFRNNESADLEGIELDAYKVVWDDGDHLMFIAGNITYIDSEVELTEDSIRLEGEDSIGRQLQGQSEWLGNLQIGYDHYPTEQKLTLLINYFDDQIFRVTRGDNVGPEELAGRTLVDLNYEKLWGDALTFRLQLKNLTNEKFEYQRDGVAIESYEEGTSVSASFTYEFL
ncbi:MAG: TonB-dependent receptor [Halieaceae bacterium]|jgi:TonB-dependent receptor|nr:TonB-dependent receptor [Halieaceae bacterium]